MENSPELTRLAIRIANTAADSTAATEACRQTALLRNLSTPRYAKLLLDVARIQNQLRLTVVPAA